MNNPATARIFVVDEHPVIVAGLRRLIEGQPGWCFVGSARSCTDAEGSLGADVVDVVILEPAVGAMDGLARLEALSSRARVLCFSALGEQLMAERVLRAGARGYLMKTSTCDEVIAAVRTVSGGGIALSDDMRRRLVGRIAGVDAAPASGLHHLNNRELQVMHLIGFNRNSRQIAEQLQVSEKTVATHRLRIREKLSLRTTNDLVRIAARWVEQDALS